MEIKNLTPHAIRLIQPDEQVVVYPPTGEVPRVSTETLPIEGEFPFEAVKVVYGDVYGLPEPEEGTILIVSKMCCDARPTRKDLWYPTELVRDDGGRVIGCRALACLAF